ncbi:molybdopterin oxidoreductase [Sorangium sp. So ce131]|uniref:molybdopterin oxidoreductase n=1 Tax=Sorangium sp. So ce131 TaxID=3133282 RepID=UPI003F62B334
METPRFIQGVYSFEGQGLEKPVPLRPAISYAVPRDKRAQLIYLRAGNSTSELIYLLLERDGRPMRYFPVGAKDAIHVPLVIVEDIHPESVLELSVGAPEGLRGLTAIDIGLAEI